MLSCTKLLHNRGVKKAEVRGPRGAEVAKPGKSASSRAKPELIGYARVSTDDQEAQAQVATLKKAGVREENLFVEKISSRRWDRPELHKALGRLEEGKVLVVWRLERLTGSLKHQLQILDILKDKKAGLKSLTEFFDTTTPAGQMFMNMLGAWNQYRLDSMRENTLSGLATARAKGNIGGRRKKLSPFQEQELVEMVRSGRKSAAEAARLFGINRSTAGRKLDRHFKTLEPKSDQRGHTIQSKIGNNSNGVSTSPLPAEPPAPKTLEVELHLRVEDNSKFVRGKGRSREEIERRVLSRFSMQKPDKDGSEYTLTIHYSSDDELECTVTEIFQEASRIADLRNGFVEMDIQEIGGQERVW